MKKSNSIILFLSVLVFLGIGFVVYQKYFQSSASPETTISTNSIDDNITIKSDGFSDGLPKPDSVVNYPLDEFGTGVAQKQIYRIDINNDGQTDKITKTFVETGNAHSYYEYKIELRHGNEYIDVTPNNLKTTNGAECDLQQIQFSLKPQFSAKIIYRELGNYWNQPTVAKQKKLTLIGNKIQESEIKTLKSVCDVKVLF